MKCICYSIILLCLVVMYVMAFGPIWPAYWPFDPFRPVRSFEPVHSFTLVNSSQPGPAIVDIAGVPSTMPPPSWTTPVTSVPTTFRTSTVPSHSDNPEDEAEPTPTITEVPGSIDKRGLPGWLQWLTETESDYPNNWQGRFFTHKPSRPLPPPVPTSWTNRAGLICHKHFLGLFADCAPEWGAKPTKMKARAVNDVPITMA